jgi:HK97 family phage major capsid protein
MEETTLTHAAAERAENAVYAESAFALTERSETVRSIGASVPVTDEQLDDVEGVQSYLEQRLTFGNMQRLDGQVVIGDGIAPNLLGLKNKAGIQVQAKGADPNPDAIYKAAVLVRLTGRAIPNAAIMHPTNWQAIRLLKTADGIYIWASPVEAGPERLWGLQIVLSDADAAGIAYVGDFANFCMLFERKGMEVQVGYVNADFLNGRRTIRAGLRVAFAVFRAAAFCQVTGLT